MSQNLGKLHCPQIFFGWYAYAHIAALSRVGLETQRAEIEILQNVCRDSIHF